MTDTSFAPPPPPAPEVHVATEAETHLRPANRKLRKSRGLWRMLAFVFLAIAVLALVGRFVLPERGPGDTIARVTINGVITTDAARQRVLRQLADDDSVKAVIITINSPGGSTAGGEELYEAIAMLRAQKPVVAVINELGASAAYMTAIGADRIYARRLSLVGSIGVLYQHVDAGKLLDTIGVDLDKVASGPLKAEPEYDAPMRPDVRAAFQSLIDDSFDWFVDVVAERRGISRQETLAVSDGRILNGRQALAARLIDDVGGEAEAIDWLETERSVPAGLTVYQAFPEPDKGFNILSLVGEAAKGALSGAASGSPFLVDGLVSLWQGESAL